MSGNIAIGIQDFSTIIQGNYFYIDKTPFIKEWWDCGDSATLITRPASFWKDTYNEVWWTVLFHRLCRQVRFV